MRGFTLIELAATLLIMALLAAAVSVSLITRRRAARLDVVIEKIARFDRNTRQHARRFDEPAQMHFDLRSGRIEVKDSRTNQRMDRVLQLPDRLKLESVRVRNEHVLDGELAINCSSLGATPTYAVQLLARDQSPRWLLFSGLTGQVQSFTDQIKVEYAFKMLSNQRGNAG